MAVFHLSEAAREDIRGIARYTLKEWGKEQRNAYIAKLDNAFTRLASSPRLGQQRNEVQQGYFSWAVERHILFYRLVKNEVEIVHILHHSMDIDRQLL